MTYKPFGMSLTKNFRKQEDFKFLNEFYLKENFYLNSYFNNLKYSNF